MALFMVLAACSSSDTDTTETTAAGGDTTTTAASPDTTGAPDGEEPAPSDGPSGTVRYGTNFIPNDWNNLTKPGEGYLALVYEKLITLEQDGVTLVPALAESWDEGPDSITLNLRQGVTFTDGTPFDAAAVAANVDRVQSTPGTWQSIFNAVENVVVVDDHTVTFELSRPDPELLPNLARRGAFMLSPASFDGEFTSPVGTGPWVLNEEETIADSVYVFDYYADYWAPEDVGPERIEMVVILENEARLNAVISGDIDIASIEMPSLPQAEAAGLDSTVWGALRHHLNFLDLDGAFADPLVRQAMCYGINWDEINAVQYDGYADWKPQRHNPGQLAYNEAVPGYEYDLARAQELMAEAGNPEITITMGFPPSQSNQGQLFVAQMAELGITVNADFPTNPQFFSTYQSGDYQAYFNTSSVEDAGITGYYFHKWNPGGTANPFDVEVPELAAIIEQAANATDTESLEALHQEFTQIVYDQALACGFYDLPHAAVWNPERVSNVSGQVWFPSHLRYREIQVLG